MLTVAWVTGMSLYTTDVFWDNYSNSGTIYIIVVPMILALTVGNFFVTSIAKDKFASLRILQVSLDI